MENKLFRIVLLCALFVQFARAQDTLVVKSVVLDKRTNEVIPNATLFFEGNPYAKEIKANSQGVAFFMMPKNQKLSIEISHPIYSTEQMTFDPKPKSKQDTIQVIFYLIPIKINEIPVVTIYPEGVPQKVFASEEVSVSDFEILANGNYVLLTYPKRLDKGSDVVLYDGQEILSTIPIHDKAVELIHDFRGNPHVVCEKSVYGLYINDNQIGIAKLEKSYFMKYLAPIMDSNYTKYYVTDFNKDYPSMSYYAFDQLDSTYSTITTVTDKLMMELYRSEYKWVDVRTKIWAKQKEFETGIDAQIWVGANYFTQSIYYKKIYAPLFYVNDTVFVFDYYRDLMLRFNGVGKILDSVPIYHHYHPKTTGWKNKIIQDKFTGALYGVYDEAGYAFIRRFDLNTGEMLEKIPIKFRYVEKMEIYNNQIYYIYRPFESAQKKFLYKEKIPLSLKPAKVQFGDRTQIKD